MTDITQAASPARSIVFIDARVQDAATLLQGLEPGAEVVFLQAGQDGLAQMADALGERGDVGAVQVIAHGSAGQLWLGNTFLDNAALQRPEVQAQLAALGRGLTADGDLLIYACNTAEGSEGAQFVSNLAALTGADVAASDDRTGAGGDWELEITSGTLQTGTLLDGTALAQYAQDLILRTVTSDANSGAGTLRQTINDAVAGDIVTFSGAMTVALDSQLIVNKNITIDGDLNNDGVADVTLDGQNKTSVIKVTSGTKTTLDGLTVTRGLATTSGANSGSMNVAVDAMGGGIHNAGNLTLLNTSVISNAAAGGGGGGGVLAPNVGSGGGGGGGIGGQIGATGGAAGTYLPTLPSANTGGNGAAFDPAYFGGRGGSANGGGAGGLGTPYGYSNGGTGGTATSGGRTIGGGGGGSGFDAMGGRGGSAVGGIYNDFTGTLAIIGSSTISGNIGAGGGGGGGGSIGGNGGRGIGAIWNKGTLQITAANNAAIAGNKGGSGAGGESSGGGANGTSPTAEDGIFNNGGILNIAYSADVTAPTLSSIVIANPSLSSGSTSLVTFTFSEAIFGLDIAEITVANGTLSNLSTTDNISWTATLTAASNIADSTNFITLPASAVQDSAGNIGTGTGTSNNYAVSDTVAPNATIVVSDNALIAGETSLVTITFSEAVTGFDNTDLSVSNGTLTAVSSGDGGITWTATLTPAGNVTNVVNAISVNMAGVQDLSANAGAGTVSSNNYAVDTVRPTATIVVADNALRIGETSLVTITFSEAVSGFTNDDLTISNGTLSAVTSSNGGVTWTATFTPVANTTDANNLITLDNTGVTDGAGNAGSGTTDSNNYAIDTLRPTATIVVADTALRAGETSEVTITFSEAVAGLDLADFTAASGSLGNLSTADNITYTATFTPSANVTDTSNVITLTNTGVTDGAGNAGSGTTDSNNYAIDTARPTATIVVADNALRIGETSQVTITFSEAVSGFTNDDLTISNGALSAVTSSNGGITWTATFTPTASTTDANNLITLDNSGLADWAGNAGSGTTDSNNYAIDTVRPTASIVVADTALKAGETSQVTITFSEAVMGFTNDDLTISNGTLSAVTSSNGGITWTATLTPNVGVTNTSNVVTLANTGVSDLAGNAGSGTTDSNNYAIDTLRPTATIVVADSALRIGETSEVTITFSEAVVGFTNDDLTVANGALTAVSSADGGITWTATLTPNVGVTGASNVINLNNGGVSDAAGNAGTGTTSSNNYQVDTSAPTATIVVSDAALNVGETSPVTITFSEAVDGFDNSDLTISNGTLSAVASIDGGVTWTATFTPSADITSATNVITLDNTGVMDQAGNIGSGTTDSGNYAIDTQRPTATIAVSDAALAAGETATLTITFSKAVTGLDLADLTVANGGLSNLSTSDNITYTATLTPSAGIFDDTNLITLDNTGVLDTAGNAGAGTTDSNNYVVDGDAPVFSTATVNGSQLVLTYTEASTLDGANLPATGDFAVEVAGTARAVTAVAINAAAKTVTLTLASAVAAGQAVTVAYTDPTVGDDTNAIQDAAGNDAGSFAATAVTNLTVAPPPPPPPPPSGTRPWPISRPSHPTSGPCASGGRRPRGHHPQPGRHHHRHHPRRGPHPPGRPQHPQPHTGRHPPGQLARWPPHRASERARRHRPASRRPAHPRLRPLGPGRAGPAH